MTTRRGHGEGGIRERMDRPKGSATRFVAEVSMGVDAKGQRIRRSFYGVTRREVSEKLKVALREQQQGALSATQAPTVAEFLDRWLAGLDIRPSTRARYTNIVRVHIVPAIGRIRLDKLGHLDVERMMREAVDAGSAPRTANHARAVLRAAINSAIKQAIVARNVASLATPRKVDDADVWVPSPTVVRTLMAALEDDPMGPLYTVALMLGLRQGEILGLRWSDVSFDEGTVTVSGALQRVSGALQRVDTKTKESRRVLVMNATVRRCLLEQRERQMAVMASAWGDPNAFVFTSIHGRPLDGGYVTHAFQKVLAKAGLPRMRFHDLRHCTATLLVAAGASPKVVQRQLGHADVTTTLRIYAHADEAGMREAAAILDRLAGSPATTVG